MQARGDLDHAVPGRAAEKAAAGSGTGRCPWCKPGRRPGAAGAPPLEGCAWGLEHDPRDPAEQDVKPGPDALGDTREGDLAHDARCGDAPDQRRHAPGPAVQALGGEGGVGPGDHQEDARLVQLRRRNGRAAPSWLSSPTVEKASIAISAACRKPPDAITRPACPRVAGEVNQGGCAAAENCQSENVHPLVRHPAPKHWDSAGRCSRLAHEPWARRGSCVPSNHVRMKLRLTTGKRLVQDSGRGHTLKAQARTKFLWHRKIGFGLGDAGSPGACRAASSGSANSFS